MKKHKLLKVLTLVLLLLGISFSTWGGALVYAQQRVEQRVFYGTLNRIIKKPDTMLIIVGTRRFTITQQTPALLKRAEKLHKKKVQVFYNKNNNHVINLFRDNRNTPR